jgi:peptidoglycan/xylan/chitin deacetylase (PgdA/CDA1 family)
MSIEVCNHAVDFPRPQPYQPGLGEQFRSRLLNWGSVLVNGVCARPRDDAFGILMYHRFANQPAGHAPLTWNVSPARFEWQIRGLLRRGFEAWPLRKVLEYRAQERRVPRNVFVVTCDDGYANFLYEAFPILRKYQVPCTLFLTTGSLDSKVPFHFDDWSAAGRDDVPRETWLPITTAQCREILASGLVEIGAHTHTHQDFRRRPDDFEADLRENVRELHDRFGITSPTFAFPFGCTKGGFAAEELVERARAAGVVSSLTTERALVRPQQNPFHWGRFAADGSDTPAMLAARLNGWNNFLRDWGYGLHGLVRSTCGRWSK